MAPRAVPRPVLSCLVRLEARTDTVLSPHLVMPIRPSVGKRGGFPCPERVFEEGPTNLMLPLMELDRLIPGKHLRICGGELADLACSQCRK
jgi:hypothetical protein